jgi:hypothetical protein
MTARACLLVLLGLGACTPKIQEEYKVEVVGDLSRNFLEGATKAVLEVNDVVVATTTLREDTSFSLKGTGVNVTTMPSGTFRVKALNDSGTVIAIGQSPEIELELASPPVVRLFMQRPGSFARTFDLDYGRRNMVAVAVEGTVTDTRAKPITVALFGLGMVRVPGEMANTFVEKPSEVLQLFNPVTQIMDSAGVGGMPSGSPHPRVDAAATVGGDKRALFFGGEVTIGTNPPAPSAQLDAVTMARTAFDAFGRNLSFRESVTPGVARIRPALVFTDGIYALGGLVPNPMGAGAMPMNTTPVPTDTIVSIAPDIEAGFTVLPQKLAGPRDHHTATVLPLASGREALIFGGTTATAPVAELLVAQGKLMVPSGNGGPPRRDHAAVLLPPGDRVLVIGGRNDTGVLGDTVLYQGASRSLTPGPFTLKRPRAEFSAFVTGDDLVIAGGVDATGALVNTAEIYGASDLQPKNLDVPCVGRTGASVVVLPHRFVLLMGGVEADPDKPGATRASAAVETYQPLVKP